MCCIIIKDNILQTEVAKKDLGLFFVLKGESAFINFTLCRNILDFDFEITRMISAQIVFHSVQLPLYKKKFPFSKISINSPCV